MPNISFFHTQRQFRTRTKFVTRRLGWENCVAGDRLNGIVKGQGLKKGEKIKKMGEIIALNVRRELLFLVDKSEVPDRKKRTQNSHQPSLFGWY